MTQKVAFFSAQVSPPSTKRSCRTARTSRFPATRLRSSHRRSRQRGGPSPPPPFLSCSCRETRRFAKTGSGQQARKKRSPKKELLWLIVFGVQDQGQRRPYGRNYRYGNGILLLLSRHCFTILNTGIILPRQARDKHRKR
jgi:hypothetical protein